MYLSEFSTTGVIRIVLHYIAFDSIFRSQFFVSPFFLPFLLFVFFLPLHPIDHGSCYRELLRNQGERPP